METCKTCKTCKYWQLSTPVFVHTDWNHRELLGTYETTTGRETIKSEPQAIADTGYAARWCTKFTEAELETRPKKDNASLFGAYSEFSAMATGEDFGCISHKSIPD